MRIFKTNMSKDLFMRDGAYSEQYLSRLKSGYEQYASSPLPVLTDELFSEYAHTGKRLGYEKVYFKRRTMLRDFALTAWLYGDSDALSRLEEIMRSVCAERTWALPAHINNGERTIDLFAAETAQTMSEIISLMGDSLSPDVTKLCVHEIRGRIIEPFANRKEPYGWELSKSNWSAVCGGCIGMAAIYLIDNDNRLREITDSLTVSFSRYADGFTDDGACAEGLYYWNYGMMYFTAFLDLYRQRMGGNFPVNTDKVKKMAEFAGKCRMGNGVSVSFSDSFERAGIYSGLSHRLHELYGAPIPGDGYLFNFFDDKCGRWCGAVRDIAWHTDAAPSDARIGAVLPSAQLAVIKNGGFRASFKGGNNGEPHNHNDIGTISVMKNGNMLICDLGAGEYSADYFSDKRYNILCNRSYGHSVPIIDGREQRAGKEFAADGFRAADGSIGADIGGAYGTDVKCRRSIECFGSGIILRDSFEASKNTPVTERFITRLDASVNENTVEILRNGLRLGSIKTDKCCKISVKQYTHIEHDGTRSNIRAVDFDFNVIGNEIFSIEIL